MPLYIAVSVTFTFPKRHNSQFYVLKTVKIHNLAFTSFQHKAGNLCLLSFFPVYRNRYLQGDCEEFRRDISAVKGRIGTMAQSIIIQLIRCCKQLSVIQSKTDDHNWMQ